MSRHRHADASAPSTGRIEVRGVHQRRANRDILRGVSLVAEPEQVLGIVGPSGSGKSTLLALMAGLEQPDSGAVTNSVVGAGPTPRIGLILQGYGLVSVLTAAENVELALQTMSARGTSATWISRTEIRARSERVLELVGLSEVADHLVEELSGGQQQRVAVARALVIEPDVLLADEFTAELDHEWKLRVVDAVFSLARGGAVVVVATHDPEITAACDQVVVLTDGQMHTDQQAHP